MSKTFGRRLGRLKTMEMQSLRWRKGVLREELCMIEIPAGSLCIDWILQLRKKG